MNLIGNVKGGVGLLKEGRKRGGRKERYFNREKEEEVVVLRSSS